MKNLITDIIKAINSGATALEANDMFIQHCSDFNKVTLEQITPTKREVIKRFYYNKMEQDTVYASLSFQADEASRANVITPRATMAIESLVSGDTSWVGLIVSNTKDENGHDIPKQFTATEMLEFASLVTADVEDYFVQRKTHCNNIEDMTNIDNVLNYDFTVT